MGLPLVIQRLASIFVVFWHGFGAYYVSEISPFINAPGRVAAWIYFGLSGCLISYEFIDRKYNFSFIRLKIFYINRPSYPNFFLTIIYCEKIQKNDH